MNVFSSACFAGCAAAFFIAAYGSACSFAAARGTYTEIARLQPNCNFSVKPRKIRGTYTGISIGFTALKFFG